MRPSSQVIADLREALLYGEWGEQALINALEQLDQSDLDAYIQTFWADAEAEVLIYGNYHPGSVQEVSAMIARVVSDKPSAHIPKLKVLNLAADESLQYAVDVPHDDSVVAWYLQGANNAWEDRAAVALTVQIMKSGFFQQLRTEQQLGYIAQTLAWPQLGVPGLIMLIQSPTADAAAVATAMKVFMGGVEGSLSAAQFERHQQALISDILRPDKNLWDRAEFYWQSIARKQLGFDGRDALAEAVQGLSRESWLEYFNEVFLQQQRSLQVVAPGRRDKLPTTDGEIFYDATRIKEGHDAYIID
jgi:secreted Zn-dependent insulinase-like peptidase